MKKLDEVLKGTIEEMRRRRRQLVAYRDKCAKDGYMEEERLQAEEDIRLINEQENKLKQGNNGE